ncbi:MAG: 2-oxoacid:acceptor oxidoreductase family protein [bacterium]
MQEITEVRWHGRGGQGTVTAAKIFAETAMSQGKYVQAFPEYGPERMGAPLRAYNRVSAKPMSLHCQVTNPKIVAVVDATLLGTVDVTEGTPQDAIFIINTPDDPKTVRETYRIAHGAVFTVDATRIALETLGKPIPNTPILGALARITDTISKEHLIEDTKVNLGKKLSAEIVKKNIEAITRAYEEVKGE